MGAQYIVVKRFSAENFVPSKAVPKIALFRELWGVNVIFLFTNPENAHLCAAARCLAYRFRGLAVERWKNLSEKKETEYSKHLCCAISHIRGKETP